MTLLAEAIAWHAAGYMPLPLKVDGSKAPAVSTWREYQKGLPSLPEVIELFKIDTDGIGLLCGEVSGGLEMLELEGRANDEGYAVKMEEAFAAHNLSELWNRILGGYVEATPSGGIHFYYRVDGPARRNTKLARRPATSAELGENPDEPLKVLIETRAEGGFTVIAPSGGRSHKSGQGWWAVYGGMDTIPVISVDERDAIHAICNTLDQVPLVEPPRPSRGNLSVVSDSGRPGDEYNDKASWSDILGKHGWTCSVHYGGNTYGWRKPGKRGAGISATTGRGDADRLFVFSTSTPFEPERPYSKFGAFALLEYGGDHSAAARALRADGYGDKREDPRTLTKPEQLAQLLRGVLRADKMVIKEHLYWVACQIYLHHPPNALDKLRQVAQHVNMADSDIAHAFGRAQQTTKNAEVDQ